MLRDIEHRWDAWIQSPRGRRQLLAWSDAHQALRTWTVDELRGPMTSRRTDAMQAALVALAQAGEPFAVTTLVVQLTPGLRRQIAWLRTGAGRGLAWNEAEEEVVSVLYETVLKHPLDRRPQHIAANLLLDTRQQLWRAGLREARARQAWSMRAAIEPRSPRPEDVVDELYVVDELSEAIHSLGGTEASQQRTAMLAYRSWILDEACQEVAAGVGMRPEAVRARLSRLRARVAR